MSEFSILPGMNSPAALKSLSSEELKILSGEIREYIIETVQRNGGHMASNLGAVELTIALHRSFNSPIDKIVWDVGHQCYTHKLLTGRFEEFKTLRKMNGLSGFPKREESPHDIMNTGHASTSVSAALGVLVGEQLAGTRGRAIAVIGDGSLTGGQALEALNYAGHLGKNLIIILNDNNMSIGNNVGAISSYMSRLTSTGSYMNMRRFIDRAISTIPFFGKAILKFVYRLKRGAKSVLFKENLFTDLGFKYIGPIDGHNIDRMEKIFEVAKEVNQPLVIHVATIKGKGLLDAEENPAGYHGVSPEVPEKTETGESADTIKMTEAYGQAIVHAAEKDKSIVALTAAMTSGTGLKAFSEKFPDRFFDVGITEPHGITYAAGMAVAGRKPFVSIYSTFMQRAVDQVIHDVAIPHLPVTIVMDRAGLVPGDGETHQGVYDISLFKNVPGLTFVAPVNQAEMELAVEMAREADGPVMIRYAKDNCYPECDELAVPFEIGRGVFLRKGEDQENRTLILSLGSLLNEAEKCALILEKKGIPCDVYNMRFIAPLDIDYLLDLVSNYNLTVLIEDGVKTGGLGEKIAAAMLEHDRNFHFRHLGAPDEFLGQATREELIRECGLDGKSLAGRIDEILHNYRFEEVVKQVRNDSWR
ncbi:1-deoxy-D-xylulose-5-phosphate synthase [Spirochaeta isovalerica]|uniref:1-deoxy-D-xylulose-5-phosphate synthase n=1 Tax=Spirochaeta isovalerica TaxID=150 RepID=A0A841RC63_9SPIO|nr:1-deoxy-D-xylulose-5-phosphate synthase [Spirochaeta isovalerica]MBB6480817.1 1-deoxy-D-xylulose-5-phosphate synthase [Spirochaeta isovalerica]